MNRLASFHRQGTVLLLAIGLIISSCLSGLAQSPSPGSAVPLLTFAGTDVASPGMITVKGEQFTPEGQVYLVLFDRAGAMLPSSHWVTANAFFTAPDGNYAYSGLVRETLGALCGLGAMVQAYDESTHQWSNLRFIERDTEACTMSPRRSQG